MNHQKDRKPTRPDIQEILSRMKSRFVSGEDSDSEDRIKEEYMGTTSDVETAVKEEVPLEKSPDDEIAELMLQLNGQVDDELVASIRSRKKIYENQPDADITPSTMNSSEEIKQEKPRIILTLRPNENKPDSYVSSTNFTDYNDSNSEKSKYPPKSIKSEIVPLKRSSRRSNDSNQSVLKSAIARKERTFSIEVDSKKRLPKKIKKELVQMTNEVNDISVNTQPVIEDELVDIKIENEIKEENITDRKKKKKKFFRGGRYNIFKKKSSQKESKNVKKAIRCQLNSKSGYFEVDSSETNSERHSVSVCSDVGTLMSSDRNYQEDSGTSEGTSLSTIDIEGVDKMNDNSNNEQAKENSLCLCNENIQVLRVDEGKVTCLAEDCIDGTLEVCNNLAYHFDIYGNMPMLRANVTLPFLTFCAHHMKRFFLHQSCPRCGRFCSEGIFMMCKNKHFSHIGCHQKERGCLHCGTFDIYDLELKRHIFIKKKIQHKEENTQNITVQVGSVKLTTLDCPPEIDVKKLSKHLQELKDDLANPDHTLYSVPGLYEACNTNDVEKVVRILGTECELEHKFSSFRNQTALHAACIKGNLMIVHLLLQAGMDPNVVDDKMKSPMRMAAKFGHSVVVQYLMNFGGASEVKDMHGMTSLHAAAKHGRLECCKVILNKRPSMVNWRDRGGWTPLVWACENGHIDVVKFFISYKPYTRIPDDENNVALHWAAISGCLEVVKCLVEYDSEVNMFNDAGDTALHIAARKNAADVVSFLIEKGAMAWHKNKAKKKPIDCCFPGTKCYTLLKNVPLKQRKPVTDVRLFTPITSNYGMPKNALKTTKVKTTPVLVSEDITHGCEDVPIRCVNEIDDEVPIEFTYIKENCYDVGNYVDSAMSHITSCNCEGACNTGACKCVQANGECLYDENGRLNSDFNYFNPSVIIYECNWRCKCHKQRCGNRVIQKGIKVELELYRHKEMGWGVRVRHDIPRGTFVCEYVGEIITDQKANSLKEDSYLFNLENPGATDIYCIDAFCYSNVSRFINHSCDPNLMSVRSFINHHDKRFPRIAFFAVQDIKKNEQLCYDYGTAFWKIKRGLFTCKCGKDNCSFSEETTKTLFIDSDDDEIGLDDENSDECDVSIKEQPNASAVRTNEINASKPQPCKIKPSDNSNILQLKNKHEGLSVSKSLSIMTASVHQKIKSRELVLKNGLPEKNKFISVVKTKEPIKIVSKQLLKIANCHSTKNFESNKFQNKLQQVMLKKKLGGKILNGNLSLGNGKKVSVTKNKSSKNKLIVNNNKVSSQLMKPVNNKVSTTYILRPKVSSPDKKITNNDKSENTVSNNVVLKSNDLRNKSIFSDASSSYQKTVGDLNYCDQSIDSNKTESVSKEFEIYPNIFNGKIDFSENPKTYLPEKEQ